MFLGNSKKKKPNLPRLDVNNPFLQNLKEDIKFEKNPFLSNFADLSFLLNGNDIALNEASVNNKPPKASENHTINVTVNNKPHKASESHAINVAVFIHNNPFLQSNFITYDIPKEVQTNSPYINRNAENDKISVVPSEINSYVYTDKTKSELSKYL